MSILKPKTRFLRALGLLRLFFNQCPRCNSDAPAVDTCFVCKQSHIPGQMTTVSTTRGLYPPTPASKALWLYSWLHPGLDSMQASWEMDVKKGRK
jgi:hypothetical protein